MSVLEGKLQCIRSFHWRVRSRRFAYRGRGRHMDWRRTSPEEMIFELRSKGWRAVNHAERQEERAPARERCAAFMNLWNADAASPLSSLRACPKELRVLPVLYSQRSEVHYTESHLSVIHSCHGSNHISPEDPSLSWSFKVGFSLSSRDTIPLSLISEVVAYLACPDMLGVRTVFFFRIHLGWWRHTCYTRGCTRTGTHAQLCPNAPAHIVWHTRVTTPAWIQTLAIQSTILGPAALGAC